MVEYTAKTRLYVQVPLAPQELLILDPGQSHYLTNVLRKKQGDIVHLFNGKEGEWEASIECPHKKHTELIVQKQTRSMQPVPDCWLVAAPIKHARMGFLVEKATELGVAVYQPILTKHSVVKQLNHDRIHANMIEAAEQCERCEVPELKPVLPIQQLMQDWPEDRTAFWCDETGTGNPLMQAIQDTALTSNNKTAMIIGPEGGFSASEIDLLSNHSNVVPVGLGPRILRAETACIAALSVIQSVLGDWQEKRR